MTVSAADFRAFAKALADNGTTEIEYRNAIGRLYYAAYHDALTTLVTHDRSFHPETGHAEFCRQLVGYPPESNFRQLGLALNYLRQQRNAADYTLNRDVTKRDVTTVFGAYGNFVGQLRAVAGGT